MKTFTGVSAVLARQSSRVDEGHAGVRIAFVQCIEHERHQRICVDEVAQ
jgi:hypothetical protein